VAKRYNLRAVKKNHPYTVEEAADALGVHEQTVRAWFPKGLRVLKSKTPYLILGDDLQSFLGKMKAQRKRPLGLNQLYCLKCRSPKTPYGNLADFIAQASGRGRLQGLCPACDSLCQRFVGRDEIAVIAPDLDIAIPACMNSLNEQAKPAVKTHVTEKRSPCGNTMKKTNG